MNRQQVAYPRHFNENVSALRTKSGRSALIAHSVKNPSKAVMTEYGEAIYFNCRLDSLLFQNSKLRN